ncbi:MAG: N-acetyltransferase, partial [Proteobacteria bacterium]|nr:N-acetyltransferase [Pseudomonadota bacterium]
LVGHILFTPAWIGVPGAGLMGWGLAPMAVHPEYQRRTIGTLMVEAGLGELRQRHAPFVVVLGHPHYYPRFGFEPASRWSLRSEWDVPEEAFLVLALDTSALAQSRGIITYRPEFGEAAGTESEGSGSLG